MALTDGDLPFAGAGPLEGSWRVHPDLGIYTAPMPGWKLRSVVIALGSQLDRYEPADEVARSVMARAFPDRDPFPEEHESATEEGEALAEWAAAEPADLDALEFDALKALAEREGVDVDGRWGEKRLRAELARHLRDVQ